MSNSQRPRGQIVTFYSFKGGTGRSMALANVAWILAANGQRVLVADWDLESPGLHRFFKPFLEEDVVRNTRGIVDLIRRYEDEARKPRVGRGAHWHAQFARIQDYAISLRWNFPGHGTLDLLTAGRQNLDYSDSLSGRDWNALHNNLEGDVLFAALRESVKERYDYVLVDSRTGLNDVADICTLHLPDTLVTCFTLSDQGIIGAATVARDVHEQQGKDKDGSPGTQPIRVLPVPMRVDQGEKEKRDAGLAFARRAFGDLPLATTILDPEAYWNAAEVPYQVFYAYEETLATFGDVPGSSQTMLAAYERLTGFITGGQITALPPMPEKTRSEILQQYRRRVSPPGSEIVLQYAAADQAWAEWIAAVLTEAGVEVVEPRPVESDEPIPLPHGDRQTLTVVSPSLREETLRSGRVAGASGLGLGFTISTARPPRLPLSASVSVAGLDATQAGLAADRLLRLVGRSDAPGAARAREAGIFPRRQPLWFHREILRNEQFTGRADVLWQVRDSFRRGESIVALTGMGGVGKTQLAAEYAFRFASTYELVWWINAENAGSVEGGIADLAEEIGIPAQAERSRTMATTLESLRRGRPTREWLLILDNADDPSRLAALLAKHVPGVAGNILVTTRSTDWERYGTGVSVPVFLRDESTARLCGQLEDLSGAQANAIAEALGDLPIAIDAAIGSLRVGGVEVPQYLDELAASTTTKATAVGRAVEATFAVALEQLRTQWPVEHRLLQVLSVMGPEIWVELVLGDEMAAALKPFDKDNKVADRTMRQPLLQRLEKFSLLTADSRNQLVSVHRLLQDFVFKQMSGAEQDKVRHQAHRVLVMGRRGDDVDDRQLWPAFRRLWPHLVPTNALHCPDPQVRQLLIDRVRYLWLRGDWAQGERLGNEIATLWQNQLAAAEHGTGDGGTEEDPRGPLSLRQQLLRLRWNLANILREQARFTEALELDRPTLEQQTELLGEAHGQTLRVAAGYAADLRALGRYQEALDREELTTRLWSVEFGDDYLLALAAANNLAVSLRAVGRFDEAQKIDERVHERRLAILGPDHPLTLHSANCIGRDMREAGDYDGSAEWLQGVLAARVRLSEPNLKGVLETQTNLATSLRSAGRVDEAGALLDDAYEQLERHFGPDWPDTLACRLNRAVNHLLRGQATAAVDEMRETVTAYDQTLGARHPLTLISRSNLSAALRAASAWDEAREVAAEAFDGCHDVLGSGHPFTLAAQTNLAINLDDAGETAEAAELMALAVERLDSLLGPDHPDVLVSRLNLAVLCAPARERERAVAAAVAWPLLTQRLGVDHPTVIDLGAGRLVYRLIDPSDPF